MSRFPLAALRGTLGALFALLCLAPAASAVWPTDPAINVMVCDAPASQYGARVVPDGAGGVIIAWTDYRFGGSVFAQRLGPGGTPLWATNGVRLFTIPGGVAFYPRVISDGQGGAFVAADAAAASSDIHVQHVDSDGALLWGPAGVAACADPATQSEARICSDGLGGCVVGWIDLRGVDYDIYVQAIDADGNPRWALNGVGAATAPGDQYQPALAEDGFGGVLVFYTDESAATPDIRMEAVNSAGGRNYGGLGTLVCDEVGAQDSPSAISDGVGAAIVTWMDARAGATQIYAQRAFPGSPSIWGVNGVLVSNTAFSAESPELVPDGAHGAIVTWRGVYGGYYDVYARRILSSGAMSWGTAGVAVTNDGLLEGLPGITPDGAGGAVIGWVRDYQDLLVQRFDASGAPQWTPGGVVAAGSPATPNSFSLAPDGEGGVVAAFGETRVTPAGESDIFAQRVDQWGLLGGPPQIVTARDVPNDQGGQVKVSWNASAFDRAPYFTVDQYYVFRSVPPNEALRAVGRGASFRSFEELASEPAVGTLIRTGSASAFDYWEYVGSQAAYHLPGYSMVVATTGDSVGGSNPPTRFLVQAWDLGPMRWWNADAMSGYSVDNLAPVAPAPFTGEYASGTSHLHWNPNAEPDFAGYVLHRGPTAGFVPGPGNLVATLPDTGYSDMAGGLLYYKLAAMDVHGNRGPFATLLPAGTVGVEDGALRSGLALGRVSPNPARARATMAFTLSRPEQVRLAVFDHQGRLVREIERGERGAGEHAATWDGLDEGGHRAPAGLYFLRLEAGHETRVRSFAFLR